VRTNLTHRKITDDGEYNAVQCPPQYWEHFTSEEDDRIYGPAFVMKYSRPNPSYDQGFLRPRVGPTGAQHVQISWELDIFFMLFVVWFACRILRFLVQQNWLCGAT